MNLTYLTITEQNRSAFDRMMQLYCAELDSNSGSTTLTALLDKWVNSILRLQREDPQKRHLEYAFDGDTPIGFLYGKIDRPEHRGYKKIGYGYIMEFFVLPEYRRLGYGRAMFERLQTLFQTDGADKLYLTTDSVSGEQFWQAMGFTPTGEKSPENGDPIYEKEVII